MEKRATDELRKEESFSIVIPTFNAGKTLKDTLASIATQSFTNYEVLIIDGGSTDDTFSIVQDFLAGLKLHWASEPDRGIYDAMNKGVKKASGKWIYFLGADDILYDQNVLNEVAAAIVADDDIVYGNILRTPSGKTEEGEWSVKKLLQQNINHQRIFYNLTSLRNQLEYDIRYRIAADHALNVRLFCDNRIIKRPIPVWVAKFHEHGFSADNVDIPFWSEWNKNIVQPFKAHLKLKEIYLSLKWYCFFNLRNKHYGVALKLFILIFSHSLSGRFLKDFIREITVSNKRKS